MGLRAEKNVRWRDSRWRNGMHDDYNSGCAKVAIPGPPAAAASNLVVVVGWNKALL
ncbi:condensin complex subunit 1 [Sesbania bispinosa]|nr:condensin complex subunit 1 [Sesbania bispinosa]